MIHHLLLSILAIITLLLTNIDVVGAEESGEPMIVVLKEEVSLEGFSEMYQADDRARLNPAAWNYLNPNVVGAV